MPDPFGTHDSFGHHNNARLQAFLDAYGFDYEFASSTDYYTSGRFDEALMRMLEVYDKVMEIMLPTWAKSGARPIRRSCPCARAPGKVLQVPIIERDAKRGTVVFCDPDTDEKVEVPVTGGNVKCQWKPDWALRWFALGIDYEMAGKDLIESVKQSGLICRALGRNPPEGFNYELFLDENGEKISKTRGNGITIEEWLRYASPESLHLFMYQSPRKAKRLLFRCHPEECRRIPDLSRQISRPGTEGTARQSGLAHPCRRPAVDRSADQLCAAAQSGQRQQLRRPEVSVGLHQALCAGCDP